MKNTNRFKTTWFASIWTMVEEGKFGHTHPLTETELEDQLRLHNLAIPSHESLAAVHEAVTYRLREFRRKRMPTSRTQEEYQAMRLSDYQTAIDACLKTTLTTPALSTLRLDYIPWLKERFGGDPKTGLNHLSDPWELKVRWLEPSIVQSFDTWAREFSSIAQNQERTLHASSISRIRTLSAFIFENSSNPIGTRKGKHAIYSPEINDLLAMYRKSGEAGCDSRAVTSKAFEVMKMIGVQSIDELKDQNVFERIVDHFNKGLSMADFSRVKPFFRWMAQQHDLIVPPLFENQKKNAITELTPEVTQWFDERIRRWLKPDYKDTSIKRPLGLLRLIFAANGFNSVQEFEQIKPAHFIRAALWAAETGYNLGYLFGIKPLSAALSELAPAEQKWTKACGQSFEDFERDCLHWLSQKDSDPHRRVVLQLFKSAFTGNSCSWPDFFAILTPQYYDIARWDKETRSEAQVKKLGGKRKDFVQSSHFEQIHEYLMTKAYGPIVANRKKNALRTHDGHFRAGGLLTIAPGFLTSEQKSELQRLTAFAIQGVGGLRFRSEADNIVYLEARPVILGLKTPACVFWHEIKRSELTQYRYAEPTEIIPLEEEKPRKRKERESTEVEKVLVFFLGEDDRKNSLPYWVPFNTVCDAILTRYIKVFDIQPGQRLLNLSVSHLADDIKTRMAAIFGTNAKIEDMLQGHSKNEAFTSHQARNMLEKYIEANYHGSDKHQLQAVLLGHKLSRDEGSATSAIYTSFLETCESCIPSLRRIKDLDPRTLEKIEFDKLHKRFDRNDASHQRTHQDLKEIKEQNREYFARTLLSNQDLITRIQNSQGQEGSEILEEALTEILTRH